MIHQNPQASLSLVGVTKGWTASQGRVDVLRDIDLDLLPGQITVLQGRSGSGKSTLLAVAGLLTPPDSGQVLIKGKEAAGSGAGG